MTDNLSIYNAMRVVPVEAQKSFTNGRFSGTDINPMWRIKRLTEMFGPCGFGWYTKVTDQYTERVGDTICAFVGIDLFVKVDGEWSMPIHGVGGNTLAAPKKDGTISVSDEAFKMAYTDALSISAKALGCGADIWWSADKTKYTQDAAVEKTPAATPDQLALEQANTCKTADEVLAVYHSFRDSISQETTDQIVKIGAALRAQEKLNAA